MNVHGSYLKTLDPDPQDKNKPLPKDFVRNALRYYNLNDTPFRYFLTKAEREKTAELLAKRLSNARKSQILDLGQNQPTEIQRLMYWDLELETAEVDGASQKAPPSPAMIAQSPEGGIDFNSNNMQMGVQKDGPGVEMHLDAATIERIKTKGFDGLEFHIQSIVPLTNLPVLLGLDNPFHRMRIEAQFTQLRGDVRGQAHHG